MPENAENIPRNADNKGTIRPKTAFRDFLRFLSKSPIFPLLRLLTPLLGFLGLCKQLKLPSNAIYLL